MKKLKLRGRPPTKSHSALLYLRTAQGLSQRELSSKVELSPMDISKFERGHRCISLSKAISLARYFGVSCSSLLYDDFPAIFDRLKQPIPVDYAARERQVRRQAGRSKVGYEGEDWVYNLELEKLKGTSYAYAVNPNYSGNERSGFDILSFTRSGEWTYIEVKSSKGGMDEPFFMSAAELLFLERCLNEGLRYELHRVSYVRDPDKRERIIYSAQEVLEKFDREVNTFKFTPKEVA